ncbi:Crp/Fnr family transcriptional regulator [uncultured Arcticibacterium sp.]|uniref:Crp/Fnr family transcriptional regulator n=1 Tax=uncultured Arcticibacterium sp. TaxID=2173042 RepID=UPI0030F50683
MSIEDIIRNIELHFTTLTEECKNDLKNNSKIISLDKETTIVKEGQFSDKTYFIAKGAARAYYLKDGNEITDWFAFDNSFISSINSFFLNTPSIHYIEVLEPSIFLEISRENVMLLSDRYREFDRLGKTIITQTMLQLQQRIVSIQFETAQKKYENLLNVRPDITNRVALTHIASYLGITLETLSRIRKPKKTNLI